MPARNLLISDRAALLLAALTCAASGCVQEMANQPRVETYESAAFFQDNQAARPVPVGTIARGQLPDDPAVATGRADGRRVESNPLPVTDELLTRGQERFTIFCDHCHGPAGYGDGMVVQRGFPGPPSYHTQRVRSLTDGQIFDVVTNGFGQMPPLSDRIRPEDRWAIIAYLRALQLSQHSRLNDLPNEDREYLTPIETEARAQTGAAAGPDNNSNPQGTTPPP